MAVTARLDRAGSEEYVLFEGFVAGGSVQHFCRAIAEWSAFGRFRVILLDLTGFAEWSDRVVGEVRSAAVSLEQQGRWLAVAGVDARRAAGLGLAGVDVFPDAAAAVDELTRRSNAPAVPSQRAGRRFGRPRRLGTRR